MKHVIVTGGAGFIGSFLCESLLARGSAVTAIDNLVTGRRENIAGALKNPNFRFIERDVCQPWDPSHMELLGRHGLSGLLHFACPASPVDFEKIPYVILGVDSIGTINAVEFARERGARLLMASTSEIYGDPLVHPQTEDYWGNVSTTGPRACYDEAKRFSEAYVTTSQRGLGRRPLNAGIVRIFNTYGPRMRPDDGRVVPELCMQALEGRPLTLHGDGKQTRSFCFVSDLVEGILKLYESDVREPVNVGNPQERTVLEFAEIVRKLSGSRSEFKHLPSRPDDPRRRCPDITRARTLLGWQPKVSIEEGMRQTIEYFRGTRAQ